MTRTIFGKVMRVSRVQALATGAAVCTALALCLLALAGAVRPAEAAFPGNNGKIAFQSEAEIYTVSASGGAATRITFPNGGSIEPAYSPDGSRIAFNRGGDIYVMKDGGMKSNGTGAKQLTATGGAESDPTWSPDGTRIAFLSNTIALDGQSDLEIWVMNANGGKPRPITNNSYPETQPAWSPDGTEIAFVSSRRDLGDTNRNIYVMDANGTNQRNLTQDICSGGTCTYQGQDDNPAWSPDGTKIAYVHDGETGKAGGLLDIWTMDPNGGNRVALSNTADVSESMPAWSPRGDKIVHVRANGTDRDIAMLNANGSVQPFTDTDPPELSRSDAFPDWQPIPVCTMRVNAANDPLTGTASNDVLCGDSRDNTIDGAGGNDIILAKSGNDTLTGATGNDTLTGGLGTDTALYSGTTAVVANLTTEFATGVGSDVLLSIENLTGSDANDWLKGSSGANSLVGGGGADAMFGVQGDDTLDSMDGVNDNDSLDGGTGTDTKITDASEKSIVGFP